MYKYYTIFAYLNNFPTLKLSRCAQINRVELKYSSKAFRNQNCQ